MHRIDEDEVSGLLRQVVRLASLLGREVHGGIGASASELFALEELSTSSLSQGELAARLGLEKSTVSRLVAGLQDKGWVSRVRDPANRRYAVVELTEAGRSAVGVAQATLARQHADLFAALSPAEFAALATGVGALLRVLGPEVRPVLLRSGVVVERP